WPRTAEGFSPGGPKSAPSGLESPGSALTNEEVGGRFSGARGARIRRSPHRRLVVAAKRRMGFTFVVQDRPEPFMRPLALSAVAACLLASPVFAQSGVPDAPRLPHRQGLSMEMPSFSEDAALEAAVAATTRPEADRA